MINHGQYIVYIRMFNWLSEESKQRIMKCQMVFKPRLILSKINLGILDRKRQQPVEAILDRTTCNLESCSAAHQAKTAPA